MLLSVWKAYSLVISAYYYFNLVSNDIPSVLVNLMISPFKCPYTWRHTHIIMESACSYSNCQLSETIRTQTSHSKPTPNIIIQDH